MSFGSFFDANSTSSTVGSTAPWVIPPRRRLSYPRGRNSDHDLDEAFKVLRVCVLLLYCIVGTLLIWHLLAHAIINASAQEVSGTISQSPIPATLLALRGDEPGRFESALINADYHPSAIGPDDFLDGCLIRAVTVGLPYCVSPIRYPIIERMRPDIWEVYELLEAFEVVIIDLTPAVRFPTPAPTFEPNTTEEDLSWMDNHTWTTKEETKYAAQCSRLMHEIILAGESFERCVLIVDCANFTSGYHSIKHWEESFLRDVLGYQYLNSSFCKGYVRHEVGLLYYHPEFIRGMVDFVQDNLVALCLDLSLFPYRLLVAALSSDLRQIGEIIDSFYRTFGIAIHVLGTAVILDTLYHAGSRRFLGWLICMYMQPALALWYIVTRVNEILGTDRRTDLVFVMLIARTGGLTLHYIDYRLSLIYDACAWLVMVSYLLYVAKNKKELIIEVDDAGNEIETQQESTVAVVGGFAFVGGAFLPVGLYFVFHMVRSYFWYPAILLFVIYVRIAIVLMKGPVYTKMITTVVSDGRRVIQWVYVYGPVFYIPFIDEWLLYAFRASLGGGNTTIQQESKGGYMKCDKNQNPLVYVDENGTEIPYSKMSDDMCRRVGVLPSSAVRGAADPSKPSSTRGVGYGVSSTEIDNRTVKLSYRTPDGVPRTPSKQERAAIRQKGGDVSEYNGESDAVAHYEGSVARATKVETASEKAAIKASVEHAMKINAMAVAQTATSTSTGVIDSSAGITIDLVKNETIEVPKADPSTEFAAAFDAGKGKDKPQESIFVAPEYKETWVIRVNKNLIVVTKTKEYQTFLLEAQRKGEYKKFVYDLVYQVLPAFPYCCVAFDSLTSIPDGGMPYRQYQAETEGFRSSFRQPMHKAGGENALIRKYRQDSRGKWIVEDMDRDGRIMYAGRAAFDVLYNPEDWDIRFTVEGRAIVLDGSTGVEYDLEDFVNKIRNEELRSEWDDFVSAGFDFAEDHDADAYYDWVEDRWGVGHEGLRTRELRLPFKYALALSLFQKCFGKVLKKPSNDHIEKFMPMVDDFIKRTRDDLDPTMRKEQPTPTKPAGQESAVVGRCTVKNYNNTAAIYEPRSWTGEDPIQVGSGFFTSDKYCTISHAVTEGPHPYVQINGQQFRLTHLLNKIPNSYGEHLYCWKLTPPMLKALSYTDWVPARPVECPREGMGGIIYNDGARSGKAGQNETDGGRFTWNGNDNSLASCEWQTHATYSGAAVFLGEADQKGIIKTGVRVIGVHARGGDSKRNYFRPFGKREIHAINQSPKAVSCFGLDGNQKTVCTCSWDQGVDLVTSPNMEPGQVVESTVNQEILKGLKAYPGNGAPAPSVPAPKIKDDPKKAAEITAASQTSAKTAKNRRKNEKKKEKQRKVKTSQTVAPKEETANDDTERLLSKKEKSRSGVRKNQSDQETLGPFCVVCKQKGHYQDNCKRAAALKCDNCGEVGHSTKSCNALLVKPNRLMQPAISTGNQSPGIPQESS